MNAEEIKLRAENAARVLREPIVVEALEAIERDVIEMFAACPTRDTDGMRILQAELRRARKLKETLQGIMESGKLAEFREKENKTFLERTKQVFRR